MTTYRLGRQCSEMRFDELILRVTARQNQLLEPEPGTCQICSHPLPVKWRVFDLKEVINGKPKMHEAAEGSEWAKRLDALAAESKLSTIADRWMVYPVATCEAVGVDAVWQRATEANEAKRRERKLLEAQANQPERATRAPARQSY